ncbi:MAG: hypothetical protein HC918_10840 [Oscillatoriales cyanobacterium SM2_1_8]|nr:hypothetical protein [Oscillatoriales cyanobacterium SM2_1_8]
MAKPCQHCHQLCTLRYRIQTAAGGPWQLVCPDCWQILQRDNPHYRYGGTWKARRP